MTWALLRRTWKKLFSMTQWIEMSTTQYVLLFDNLFLSEMCPYVQNWLGSWSFPLCVWKRWWTEWFQFWWRVQYIPPISIRCVIGWSILSNFCVVSVYYRFFVPQQNVCSTEVFRSVPIDTKWSLVHQHIVFWQQLRKGCPLVQIHDHGDGKQEHLLLHSGHLLCRHNKGLLGREKVRGSSSPSREGCCSSM